MSSGGGGRPGGGSPRVAPRLPLVASSATQSEDVSGGEGGGGHLMLAFMFQRTKF